MFGAVGGASTCGAALVLFLGSLRDESIASWLFIMFGVALGCTACALTAFLVDTILAFRAGGQVTRDGLGSTSSDHRREGFA